jgi:16S rRNA (guanine527-N7)-methyltransferase
LTGHPPIRPLSVEAGEPGRFVAEATVKELLIEAQRRGFLGGAPVTHHLEHSLAFAAVVAALLPPRDATERGNGSSVTARFLDLGSGAGVPGLVIASARPDLDATLVEASEKRARWLKEAVDALNLSDRVEIVNARAEAIGRRSGMRETFDLVVSRAFGHPAVAAECAAPFLRVGGCLIVSEPPSDLLSRRDREPLDKSRWPPETLSILGYGPARPVAARERRFALLPLSRPCPEAFPRRTGVPEKRPLY